MVGILKGILNSFIKGTIKVFSRELFLRSILRVNFVNGEKIKKLVIRKK